MQQCPRWPCAASSTCFAVQGLKRLPVDTAYAPWTGIGSVGVIVGMALFDNPVTALRIGCIVLIAAGVFGRRLAGSGSTCATRGPRCGKGLARRWMLKLEPREADRLPVPA